MGRVDLLLAWPRFRFRNCRNQALCALDPPESSGLPPWKPGLERIPPAPRGGSTPERPSPLKYVLRFSSDQPFQ